MGLGIGAVGIAFWRSDRRFFSQVMKRITTIEAELAINDDRVESLHLSLKKLHSRAGMREVREKRGRGDDDIPDSREDPEGWKRAMRAKYGLTGLLKKSNTEH
jgi:hypothetical protein